MPVARLMSRIEAPAKPFSAKIRAEWRRMWSSLASVSRGLGTERDIGANIERTFDTVKRWARAVKRLTSGTRKPEADHPALGMTNC